MREMAAAMVAAFPDYLVERVERLGVAVDDALAGSIRGAARDLEAEFERLIVTSDAEQRRSPLELVRGATHPITAILAASGVPPVRRDDQDVSINPDDTYDLYPASSRDLGDQAWRAHVRWGLAKTRAVAGMVPAVGGGRTVALFGVGKSWRDDLAAAVKARGFNPEVWRNPAALAEGIGCGPVAAFVDISHPTSREAIRVLAAEGVQVVAVGEQIDDYTTAALMALGATHVEKPSGLVDRLDLVLPRIA